MSDLFTSLSEIAARLTSEVTAATTYYGSQIIGANNPTLPALIVAPGEAAALDPTLPPRSGGATERHQWRVGVRCAVNPGVATAAGRAEHVIGALCYSVIDALNGYQLSPSATNKPRLQYLGRDEMMYAPDPGYVEVWLKFSADMAIS